MDIPKYFNNVVLAQYVVTGIPLKVYVNGGYLIIPDVDEIADPLIGSGMNVDGEMEQFDYRMIDHLLVGGNVIDLATYTKALAGDTPEKDSEKKEDEEETKEESVNEGKMPDKYVGNDEIVYLKTKEDSKGANYNLYYKGHDIDAGGRRFSGEKELKDFAANYILSNQLYNKLKHEKPKPLPESVNEATRQELGMSSSVSKSRAKAALRNPRNDGSKVYGLDKNGKRVELKSINDINKFKKFEIDADLKEANKSLNLSDIMSEISKDEFDAQMDALSAEEEAGKAKIKAAKDKMNALKKQPIEDGVIKEDHHYTFGVGDIVKNKNTSCPHHGSMGVVQKIMNLANDMGKVVKYRVVNSGPTYSPGDVLVKTLDQLESVN